MGMKWFQECRTIYTVLHVLRNSFLKLEMYASWNNNNEHLFRTDLLYTKPEELGTFGK